MQTDCESVTHRYRGGKPALSNVSLHLKAGVTGLVGVNGAGKSTLLRILSGGLRFSSGSVRVLGADLYGRGRRTALASTALMPQDLDVPRDMRVIDVVTYIGWLRGLSSRVATVRGGEVLEAVGLADRRTSKVSELSGGMARRLALAQALVAQPSLLLLDEPTTGLDPEQRAAVRDLISELPRDRITVVSSHVMEDIETLARDVVVLDQGEVLFHGPVSEFVSQDPSGSAEQAFLRMLISRRDR